MKYMKGPRSKPRTAVPGVKSSKDTLNKKTEDRQPDQQSSVIHSNDGTVDGLVATPIVNEQEQEQVTNQSEEPATPQQTTQVTNDQLDPKDIY